MKSKKIILQTSNRRTDDGEGTNSTSTSLQCKMYFKISTQLLIVILVMLVYSMPLTRGNALPFVNRERTPARENCTGQACVEQRAQVERMRKHRLATIQLGFLEKLGLEGKPNVTKEIPKTVIDKAVKKVLERSNPKSEPTFPEGYFAEVSEIVSFAEEVLGK